MAWTHDSATVELADTAADTTAQSAPPEFAIATPCWTCRRCGERQPAALRLGFVRHGVGARRRHDHSP